MAWVVVIFGAAVLANGEPSSSLRRRIAAGLKAAQDAPEAKVFCSGGVGRFGASEASLMAQRLTAAGIEPHRLVLDEHSRDTLQNARAAAHFIRQGGHVGAITCTHDYHMPRVRLLLAIMGVPTRPGPARVSGGTRLGFMWLREIVALPYDACLAVVDRLRG